MLRDGTQKTSALERDLAARVEVREPLWPMATQDGGRRAHGEEKEILRSLAEGLSTAAIARKLFIAPVTVRNHVQNLLHKLDVHSKLAAVVYAYQHGLIGRSASCGGPGPACRDAIESWAHALLL